MCTRCPVNHLNSGSYSPFFKGETQFCLSVPILTLTPLISDPKICHSQPTFRGTRIFVEEVLEQTANDMAGEALIEERHGNITKTAIAEAMQVANQSLLKSVEASDGPA